MTAYTINKRFTTKVERSARVLDVAEGFGIGLGDREFVVFDNLEIEVKQGDVVYIHGQSGSGKSVLLRELSAHMTAGGLKIANIDLVELQEIPVIEQVGKTMPQATSHLAKAGISDAYIYLRKPSELSDGQRYRLRLAKLIDSDADVWVADEFGAVLDRPTAKVIAYNLQKLARELGKTLLVATTHSDLELDLSPSVKAEKRHGSRVDVSRPEILP
jgi:hypothetical protein